MNNKSKHFLSIAVLFILIFLALGSVDNDDGNRAQPSPPQPINNNSDQSNNDHTEESKESAVDDNPNGFPPEPKLGEPPEKPDLKVIYNEKLATPDKYTVNWIPPVLDEKVRFVDLKGIVYEGKLIEFGDDYIKILVDNAKFTYKKDKMRRKYRIKYLKIEFIKYQAYDEVMKIHQIYKAEYALYIKPKQDWKDKIQKIKDDKIRADVINKLADEEDARKRTQIKAYGPEPSMTIIGWTQTVPIIVKLALQLGMHDFDSFDKVFGQLLYSEYQGVKCWVYNLTYRGNNAFGAKVITSTKFYIRDDQMLGMK